MQRAEPGVSLPASPGSSRGDEKLGAALGSLLGPSWTGQAIRGVGFWEGGREEG